MDELRFKISSALKDLVGKDLITSDKVAIFELVKNSYDAYASKVIITFAEDRIIIADNGKGMTYDEIRDKWLFVGYSEKKDGAKEEEKQQSYRDRIKRYYAGAKGIGRFSCDRLGRFMTMTTCSKDSSITERIIVDWEKFEKDQRIEFANIKVEHEVVSTQVSFPLNENHGTIIEITDLHDEETPWTRKHILELKRSLEKLINPISETNDFAIEIVCEREKDEDQRCIDTGKGYDRNIVNGILKNSITSIIKLKTTQIDVRVDKSVITTVLSDRGVDIYRIKEDNREFNLLEDATVSISFLNRAAKYNFSRIMGVDAVNYGSVFLFRNGFRILPFGETGDDSWGLDFRAQQGYNRHLGSRDLLGRVDIHTERVDELKEVSSRDGGLVDRPMARQVKKLFETAHRRLERYVVGVLWGEGFLKNAYFSSDEEGKEERKKLQAQDKDSDTPDYVLDSSLGSKIDFVRLIKTLSSDDNVEILYYNSDLANLLSDQFSSNSVKPQFITDLESIAQKTGDSSLMRKISEARRRIEELTRQREEAERKAAEAERRAAEAEVEKRKAEQKAADEEEKRRAAEIAKLKAENERIKAENEKLKAEQKAAEEQKKREKAEKIVEQKTKQNLFLQSVSTLDKERILNFHHDIRIQAQIVKNFLSDINDMLKKGKISVDTLQNNLSLINGANAKILSIAQFATKANFNSSAEIITADIIEYIEQYIKTVLPDYYNDLHFISNMRGHKRIMKFKPLELSLEIDNLVSNSVKAKAKNFHVDCNELDDKLVLEIYDDGIGLPQSIDNAQEVFEKGYTTTNGSGLGLYDVSLYVKKTMKGVVAVDETYVNGFKLKIIF